MSPASKSKSKDKRAANKDPQKSVKPTSNANAGVLGSGYNPLLGTFHALDTTPVSTAQPIHTNGRSRNFDDTEDHNGNLVMGIEYDSLSNNGSWSGESEDHKDKPSQVSTRHDTVDNDKREKIRQKNEKKHQRQKERRAQELHEKCSGYLMSRKLESLAQQLVSMGFSSERATMALILNEGRVEQSVAWLLEGGEESNNQQEHNNSNNNIDGGGNLKIDISEELALIAEMEVKFKCSKQEIERVIVACEGDLDQAVEALKVQKQELPAVTLQKNEETGDSLTTKMISKAVPIHQKADEKDLNNSYTKLAVTDHGIKSLQLLKKVPPNSDWTVNGSNPNSNNPSVSYSSAFPLHAASVPARTEPRYSNIANELKNIQLGSVREPVIVMQRPKSKILPSSVSPSSSASDWHPNIVDPVMNMNANLNGFSHGPTVTRGFNSSSFGGTVNSSQLYDQFHYSQHQHQFIPQQQQQQQHASSSGPFDHFSQQGSMNHFNNGGMWNRTVGTTATTTPTLAPASSLGLFSGLGSNGSSIPSGPSSPVDWNACDSLQFDYTNIDWSLDRLPHPSSSPSSLNGNWMYSPNGGKSTATRPPTGSLSIGNYGLSIGLDANGLGPVGTETSVGASREWASPFEEKELFSFHRQFVSSPSR